VRLPNPPIDSLLARAPRQPRDPVTGEPVEYERTTTAALSLAVHSEHGHYTDWSALDSDDRWPNE
jgi:hypothetical protein